MMTDVAAEREVDGAGRGGAGPTRAYVCPARDQLFLMPVSMRDWLDEDHLVWFVIDVVGQFDTSGLHRRPGGCPGRPPFEPEMMCTMLLYGYCCGIRRSRRLEASCRTDAAFRVICGGLMPDHATIARFVVDHERVLEGLFVDGLRLCSDAGLCDLSVVALDGTKIAADASLAKNRDAQWIRKEVAQLMAVTGQEEEETAGAGALPGVESRGEICSPAPRLARLEASLAVIEAQDAAEAAVRAEVVMQQTEAAAAAARQGRKLRGVKPSKDPAAALVRAELELTLAQQRAEARARARAAKLQAAAAAGRAMRGPKPGPHRGLQRAKARLEQARAAAAAASAADCAPTARRVNITDPDSRIMTTKDGWVQGYNCQAFVNPNQIVLAVDVHQDPGDVQLYEPMNDTLTQTLAAAGITPEIGLELADAGYCSEHNLTSPGPDRLIATQKDHKQRRAARELGLTDGPPPPGLTATEEMEHLLRTPQGAAAYKQRSSLIEPIFGDRKHNHQMRRFRRRGLDAVRSEWAFANLAGNIRKLYKHHTTQLA
jgi:transposase